MYSFLLNYKTDYCQYRHLQTKMYFPQVSFGGAHDFKQTNFYTFLLFKLLSPYSQITKYSYYIYRVYEKYYKDKPLEKTESRENHGY